MTDTVHGREHQVRRQQAMSAVFLRFSRVWPKAFNAKLWPDMLETWLDNCRGIDTEQLEPAAREMLSGGAGQYPPKPWEFGKFARGLQRQRTEQPAPTSRGGVMDGARPFWFERETPDGIVIAQGMALAGGGSVGISEVEMDRLYAHEIAWGWGVGPMEKAS